jgi:hydrogenase expression/formation protein HypC
MCLAIPGKVLRVEENALGMTMGAVSFAGITKEVCLAYVPEVKPGEYVMVHVGFAISRVSEEEAQEVFRILREMGELAELDGAPAAPDPAPPAGPPPRP